MIKNLTFLLVFLFSGNVLADGFYLSSTDVQGQLSINQVFNGFGCSGKNISPQLSWTNAPAGTKSFAITAYDPDAPTGSGWWHWVVFNIDKSVDNLKAGASSSGAGKPAMPAGAVESVTSYGTTGFGGACPPPGDKPHRYIFTVYALDVEKLAIDAAARAELIGFNLNSHALAKASVMAYYGR
jgi:Raf kinase inhibitor-like YbhB/YbcL family protein